MKLSDGNRDADDPGCPTCGGLRMHYGLCRKHEALKVENTRLRAQLTFVADALALARIVPEGACALCQQPFAERHEGAVMADDHGEHCHLSCWYRAKLADAELTGQQWQLAWHDTYKKAQALQEQLSRAEKQIEEQIAGSCQLVEEITQLRDYGRSEIDRVLRGEPMDRVLPLPEKRCHECQGDHAPNPYHPHINCWCPICHPAKRAP